MRKWINKAVEEVQGHQSAALSCLPDRVEVSSRLVRFGMGSRGHTTVVNLNGFEKRSTHSFAMRQCAVCESTCKLERFDSFARRDDGGGVGASGFCAITPRSFVTQVMMVAQTRHFLGDEGGVVFFRRLRFSLELWRAWPVGTGAASCYLIERVFHTAPR